MTRRANIAVVLVILLIVAGLGVPFVYRVRNAANAIKCRNNLREIGSPRFVEREAATVQRH